MPIGTRIKHAWNAFVNEKPEERFSGLTETVTYGRRPDISQRAWSNERSIISSIYTRLCIDIAVVSMRHVRLDDEGRYKEDIQSGLNSCLTLEANIDQAAQDFRIDLAMTLFDKGVAAIVPVDTTLNPNVSGSFDIQTMRVGEVVEWRPRHVKVRVYNEATGKRVDLTLEKKFVAIVYNPLYSVMNEPNSTLQRIIRKLNLLDAVDEQSGSGKLDIIIQLPYVIKSEARREQAEQRRKDIEFQLKGSQYGIAYTDGTEKITQLNRPAENNLLSQIQYLIDLLYSQLGLTAAVLDGTADQKTMLNYYNRTIEPILTAIQQAMVRSFITKTGRTQGQTILFFRDVFKLVPVESIADIADKFARNEILTSNELRQIVGFKPSTDKNADKLMNSNMPQPKAGLSNGPAPSEPVQPQQLEGDSQNGS